MSDKVVFFRPVEKVGNVVTTLMSYPHSFFPVVDPKDNGVLFGTIGRNELCVLLQQRAFGPQPSSAASTTSGGLSDNPQVHVIQYQGQTFTPLVQWTELEKTDHPRYPDIQQIVRHSLRHGDQDCLMDLRPYANTAPITIQQKASIGVRYYYLCACSSMCIVFCQELPCLTILFVSTARVCSLSLAAYLPTLSHLGNAVSFRGESVQSSRGNHYPCRFVTGILGQDGPGAWQKESMTRTHTRAGGVLEFQFACIRVGRTRRKLRGIGNWP